MSLTLAGRQPKELDGRYGLPPGNFIKQIAQMGVSVLWEKGMRCPCDHQVSLPGQTSAVTQMTGEPDHDCVACGNSGVIYHSAQTVKALVTSAKDQPELFLRYGDQSRGMVNISMLPEHQPGELDRFTAVDHVRRFSETRIRRAVVESLRYPVASVVVRHGDSDPTNETTTTVKTLHVVAADATGEIVTDAGSPKVYADGTDYEVDGNGDIDWTIGDSGGTAPSEGQRYAVDYLCRPVYIAHDLVHVGRWAPLKDKTPAAVITAYPHFLFAKLETMGAAT